MITPRNFLYIEMIPLIRDTITLPFLLPEIDYYYQNYFLIVLSLKKIIKI